MIRTGSFATLPVNNTYIYVEWESNNGVGNNQTDLSWNVYSMRDDGQYTQAEEGTDILVTINNEEVYSADSVTLYDDRQLGSGDITIDHNADGTKIVTTLIEATIDGESVSYTGTITLLSNNVYSLSKNNTVSTITVNRIYSSAGDNPGAVSTGSNKLAFGDQIQILADVAAGYTISSVTVNNNQVELGNTLTVNGNVSIVATEVADVAAIGATSGFIGEVSAITIAKPVSSYYSSVQYSIGSLSGYVTSVGGTSSNEQRFLNVSIPFTIPSTFYQQITTSLIASCTLTLRLYASQSGGGPIMTPITTSFEVRVPATGNYPDVSFDYETTDAESYAIFGTRDRIIQRISDVAFNFRCTPKNGATTDRFIFNGQEFETAFPEIQKFDLPISELSLTAFDSRGLSTTYVEMNPNIVPYTPLTVSGSINRLTSSSDSVFINVFGKCSSIAGRNSVSIRYRYKLKSSETYSSWNNVSSSDINITDQGNTFTFTLDNLDPNGYEVENILHNRAYDFQIEASESANGVALSSQVIDCTAHSTPICDWDADSFNVNGTFTVNGRTILDIAHPVGSYWIQYDDEVLDPTIAAIGTWSFTARDGNLYIWCRDS